MIDLAKLHAAMQQQMAEERQKKLDRGETVLCANDCSRAVPVANAHPFEVNDKTVYFCRRCCPRCEQGQREA